MYRNYRTNKSVVTLLCTLILLMGASAWLFNNVNANASSAAPKSTEVPLRQLDSQATIHFNANFVADDEEEEEERERDEDEDRERDREEDEENEEQERRHQRDFENMERHERELNLLRAELEVNFGRWEMINKVREIAEERKGSAAYAVMITSEIMKPEAAIDFLEDTLNEAKDKVLRRVIRIKLIELYGPGNSKKSKQHLRKLILE